MDRCRVATSPEAIHPSTRQGRGGGGGGEGEVRPSRDVSWYVHQTKSISSTASIGIETSLGATATANTTSNAFGFSYLICDSVECRGNGSRAQHVNTSPPESGSGWPKIVKKPKSCPRGKVHALSVGRRHATRFGVAHNAGGMVRRAEVTGGRGGEGRPVLRTTS